MRYAQIVMGLKGSGKSTYCKMIAKYAECRGRKMRIVNLDPTAGVLVYETPIADVRDVINLEEYREADEGSPGTGAGFEYALSYLVDHPEWLFGAIGEVKEGDYILFDCPGEVQFHAHLKTMKVFAAMLVVKNFRTCGVFVRDSRLALNGYNFIGSCLTPLTSYINLSIPHVNLLMKVDLLADDERARLQLFINSDVKDVLRYENSKNKPLQPPTTSVSSAPSHQTSPGVASNSSYSSNSSSGGEGAWADGFHHLAKICSTASIILEGHNLVRKKYFPFDIREEASLKGFQAVLDDMMGITED